MLNYALVAEVAATADAAGIPAWAGDLLVFLIKVFTPVVLGFVTILMHRLYKKAGIESIKGIDELVDQYVKRGIDVADAWARKQADKPRGEDKAQKAFDFILPLIKAANLPEMAEEKMKELVEAKLAEERKGGFHESIN